MFRLRRYILEKLEPHMTRDRAKQLVSALRVAYFFSATSILFLVVKKIHDSNEKVEEIDVDLQLELGKPIIEDTNEAFKKFRIQGVEYGVIYTYKPDEGLVKEEYNRKEYLQKLEKEALERAKEAQRKVLAEGRELPPGAIKLV